MTETAEPLDPRHIALFLLVPVGDAEALARAMEEKLSKEAKDGSVRAEIFEPTNIALQYLNALGTPTPKQPVAGQTKL